MPTEHFFRRAVAWYAEHGITVERVLSDNGNGYRSFAWCEVCVVRQESPLRLFAGSRPAWRGIFRTIVADTCRPRPLISPAIRWYPTEGLRGQGEARVRGSRRRSAACRAESGMSSSAQPACRRRQKRSVSRAELRARYPVVQHRQLMPQHDYLGFLELL